MAKHEVVVYPNATSTSTEAPFLGRYAVKTTVSSENFYDDVAKELGITVSRAKMILQEMLECIKEDFKLQAAKYNLNAFSVAPVVSGQFTSINQNFDWTTDSYILQVYYGREMRNYLANITPHIAADGDATKVKINHVQGEGMPRDVVDCYGEFTYQGKHLNMGDAGAEAYVLSKSGVKTTLITTPGNETYGTAHLFAPVTPDSYLVCFKSRGGDAEGPLQLTAKSDVRILSGTAPTPSPTMPTLLSFLPVYGVGLADVMIDTEGTAPGWPEGLARLEFEASNGRTGYLHAENMGAGQIQIEIDVLWTGDKKLNHGDKIKVWAKNGTALSNKIVATIA